MKVAVPALLNFPKGTLFNRARAGLVADLERLFTRCLKVKNF